MTNALKNSIARLGNKLDDHKKDGVPMKLALDSLVPYGDQARTQFDPEPLQELADSIKEIGVVEPLLVRMLGDGRYEIIAGERRFRAAKMAGLTHVPVLLRQLDDATADKIHLAENIHRENLSTLDLAQRVHKDATAAGGDLAKVAAKYNKGKSWVSKLLGISQGGGAMTELVEEGVTSDRAVLAAVASLERKAPDHAKALSQQLKGAPAKANKRVIAEKFMQEIRANTSKGKSAVKESKSKGGVALGVEPSWRKKDTVERTADVALIVVQLSPVSAFANEFADLSKKHGAARLVVSVRHPDEHYAIVQFGSTNANRRAYRADELRLLSVC